MYVRTYTVEVGDARVCDKPSTALSEGLANRHWKTKNVRMSALNRVPLMLSRLLLCATTSAISYRGVIPFGQDVRVWG